MVIKCICSKKENRICVGHQINPIKERDKEMGLFGQEIWLTLQKHRFVGREDGLHYKLSPFEERLKYFLIWRNIESDDQNIIVKVWWKLKRWIKK